MEITKLNPKDTRALDAFTAKISQCRANPYQIQIHKLTFEDVQAKKIFDTEDDDEEHLLSLRVFGLSKEAEGLRQRNTYLRAKTLPDANNTVQQNELTQYLSCTLPNVKIESGIEEFIYHTVWGDSISIELAKLGPLLTFGRFEYLKWIGLIFVYPIEHRKTVLECLDADFLHCWNEKRCLEKSLQLPAQAKSNQRFKI